MIGLYIIIYALVLFSPFIVILLIYIGYKNSDRGKHPEEYRTKGSTGERYAYLGLLENGVPENQIFRNVYLPTKNGTTEIDIVVVSKKGILIFECKNYHGNIYGDGNRDKWIQYIGNQKNYFYSPVKQNRGHVKRMKEHFSNISGLPVIPFIVTTSNAKWHLKNIDSEDHILGRGEFSKVYELLPDSKIMAHWFKYILMDLKKYERPDAPIQSKHNEAIMKIK